MVTSVTANDLFSICFPVHNIGYAAGTNGTFLKSLDGGVSWFNLLSGTGLDFHYVNFTDHLTGYLAGNNGCILKTIDGGVGIEERHPKITFSLFPDPGKDHITLEIPRSVPNLPRSGSLFIYNLMGQLMLKQTLSNNRTEINISSLPSGLYMIKVISNGASGSGKFIRE
jgi:hypothetical protein